MRTVKPMRATTTTTGVPRMMAAALMLLLAGASGAGAGERLEVTGGWVRHAPASAQNHAGYLTLANAGATAQTLVAVESPAYAKVELHLSHVRGGIATMEPVAQVEIAPGQTVSFAPGGLHLMLIGPKAPMKLGSSVDLTLSFGDGSRLAARAVVRKDAASGHHHGH